ncbi:MAG: DUF393 domain-containing protein [Pseudomonadota bacterium]
MQKQPDKGPRLTVFFDGACPLCVREIGFYRRRRGADGIDWIDVSAGAQPEIAPGLSRCDALARFHVRDAAGAVHSGARAFAERWAQLPLFRPLGLVVKVQPFLALAEGGYRIFLRIRPRLQDIIRRRAA